MKFKPFLKKISSRFKSNSRLSAAIERSLRDVAGSSGLGFDAGEWASLIILAGAVGLVLSFSICYFLFSPLQALGLAIASGFSAALGVYALPFISSSRNAKVMERELPMFLARLLSTYAERRDMSSALKVTIYSFDGRLVEMAKPSFAIYLAGSDAQSAFSPLSERSGSRHVSRAFSLISKSLETGLDVGEALEDVARSTSSSLEFEAEKESRTGLVSWVISASSAFFFPMFAALGLVMMSVLQKIASLSPYTPAEQGFIELSVLFYLFAGVFLDAGYNGRMKLDGFGKGVLAFTAPLALTALVVFILVFKLANSMTGG